MKDAGRTSSFALLGAIALSLPGTMALGQSGRTGAPAPAPMPATRPDLAFKEVQVFFPAFNLGLRLAPPGGPAPTPVLRLVQDPAVAPGTKLGPDEASGQPGPIATRSCGEPLHATVRVWVSNLGGAAFDATTDALGLSGTVAAQPVKAAFGKVANGQTLYVEAGSLSLAPGSGAAILVLNTARGGGETNFANNAFESRFQITCGSPANPANPAEAPASVAGGGVNAGARLAAPAMLSAGQPTPVPRNLGGMMAPSGVLQCIVGGVSQRYIGSVDGTKNGVTFTPGGTYEIAGCGFGTRAGQVYLGAYISGQGEKKIPLTVARWGEQSVSVHADESLNSLPDVGSVSLNLIPFGEPESRTIGFTAGLNRFTTEKETRWVRPGVTYGRLDRIWGHAVIGIDSSGERATVTRKQVINSCTALDPLNLPTDDWDVRTLLDRGFKILSVDVVNQTDKTVLDNDGVQEVVVGGTGEARFVPSLKVVRVFWEGHSTYEKPATMSIVKGTSICTSAYTIRLQVEGPKGVDPFP